MLKKHDRYEYSSIRNRPFFQWPGKKNFTVYVALNLEHFAFGDGEGAELAPKRFQPDILNYSWRDYGNRVGVWRLLQLFEELKLPCALLVNGSIYDYCPEVVSAFRSRGDEIVAHGMTNAERQGILEPPAEAALIQKVTDLIAKHEGQPPRGWLGPWISESVKTPDLLKKAGYRYFLDWAMDDQPIWFKTAFGNIVSVPYPQELNDIPTIVPNRASATEFADMIVDQFDEMLLQSQEMPLVFGISLHTYIVGQPFRLRHLRRALQHVMGKKSSVWLTHPGKIAEHFSSQVSE